MIRPLWWKAIVEARILLAAASAVLFGFSWLFVWLSSMIELGPLAQLLQALPAPIERLSGIPFADVTTSAGLISVLYVDPVILVTCAMWAVARGSDAVSGEISRGTMEVLLAQPVRRFDVLFTQAVVTTVGAAILALSVLVGTWAGILTVKFPDSIHFGLFFPAVFNLFCLTFALCGGVTLLSAMDRYRARTVGIAGGLIVIQFIQKIVARMWPDGAFLSYTTVFGAYEPQVMIRDPSEAWRLALEYGTVLVVLGFFFYAASAVVFCRRDLPQPL